MSTQNSGPRWEDAVPKALSWPRTYDSIKRTLDAELSEDKEHRPYEGLGSRTLLRGPRTQGNTRTQHFMRIQDVGPYWGGSGRRAQNPVPYEDPGSRTLLRRPRTQCHKRTQNFKRTQDLGSWTLWGPKTMGPMGRTQNPGLDEGSKPYKDLKPRNL